MSSSASDNSIDGIAYKNEDKEKNDFYRHIQARNMYGLNELFILYIVFRDCLHNWRFGRHRLFLIGILHTLT